MDLPVELWMRVFEHIDLNDCYARGDFVQRYKDVRETEPQNLNHRDTDYHDNITARKTLLPFEESFWASTRALYAVNRNSRAAAQRLRLSQSLLFRCGVPTELEWGSFRWIDPLDPDPPSTYSHGPSVFMVFRLFSLSKKKWSARSRHFLWMNILPHSDDPPALVPPMCATHLRVARHVVLLSGTTPPQEAALAALELHAVKKLKSVMEQFWKMNNIQDGRVEVSSETGPRQRERGFCDVRNSGGTGRIESTSVRMRGDYQ